MTNWERRLDRVLGYLGLLLIGSLSWLADHTGGPRDVATKNGDRSRPRVMAADRGQTVGAASEVHAGRRAA
jgi:hypothetical protein